MTKAVIPTRLNDTKVLIHIDFGYSLTLSYNRLIFRLSIWQNKYQIKEIGGKGKRGKERMIFDVLPLSTT